MVGEYKVGYIKMDYNVDGLEGTEYLADSPGQGLLEHNRALLSWLDDVLARYPELTIENCGSGGGRMEYAMLSHLAASVLERSGRLPSLPGDRGGRVRRRLAGTTRRLVVSACETAMPMRPHLTW